MTMTDFTMGSVFSLADRFTFRRSRLPLTPQRRARPERRVLPLRPRVEIPVRDPAPDIRAREAALERGQFLARQEAWEELCDEIIGADLAAQLTPGRSSVAALLAQGARADLVEAGRAAVAKGEPKRAWAVVQALEVNLEDMPDCPAMAAVVALAHIDLARAWRGASEVHQLAPQRRTAWKTHMRSAAQLADRFDPFEHGSALWAQIRCDVLDFDPSPAQRVADDYEDLVDLSPGAIDPLKALGRALLPTAHGSREALDVQARRTALRTQDIWGLGGYAWVYMGALEEDPGAFRRMDMNLFAEALHDIVRLHPDQDMVNRLAAFTGMSVLAMEMNARMRRRFSDCFAWLAQDHLREIHPAIWASAPAPARFTRIQQDAPDSQRRGRVRAISTIAEHFAPLLSNGRRLVFGDTGLKMPRIE